jgi:hypothetical protein
VGLPSKLIFLSLTPHSAKQGHSHFDDQIVVAQAAIGGAGRGRRGAEVDGVVSPAGIADAGEQGTRTVRTQSNHIFMSIFATFKLEGSSIKNKLNPFALCRKLLINASRTVYAQLQQFRAAA